MKTNSLADTKNYVHITLNTLDKQLTLPLPNLNSTMNSDRCAWLMTSAALISERGIRVTY